MMVFMWTCKFLIDLDTLQPNKSCTTSFPKPIFSPPYLLALGQSAQLPRAAQPDHPALPHARQPTGQNTYTCTL